MADPSLTERFPDLQPGKQPSGLGSLNGFGTRLIGSRDRDAETGTYVVTHVFTALFVPIFALGAYRVADAQGGGWYCLGKVRLSALAKGWNLFLVLAIAGGIGFLGWNSYSKSPEYVAGRKLREADQAAAEGRGGDAARLCREVMDSPTEKSGEAGQKLAGLIENPPGPPEEAAAVYTVAVDLHREDRCPVPNLFAKGQAIASKHAADHPEAALSLLEVIAPFAPDPATELDLRRDLLERLYARSPNDPETASRLAAVCEAKGDRERCEKILLPLEPRLGALDGAAILGRIYAGRGEKDKAIALLKPYVDARLAAMRQAEQAFPQQLQDAQSRAIELLKSGKAPDFDYDRHKLSSEQDQELMENEFIFDFIKADAGVRTARQELMKHQGVISAVLDLGMVQLQRGQELTDPEARKKELQEAEQTLLSIRGAAGETDQYRLSLGQVYYWLGRPAEGKKLFDELLQAREQAPEVMVLVAKILREVGDHTEARRLAEDAYSRQTDVREKQSIASFRARLRTDIDDEIVWLGRSDTGSPEVRAALASARGHKAERDGKDDEAAGFYRDSIGIYAGLPENAATLNNAALAHFSLYQVTRDQQELTRGLDKLDRAIALMPSDSILVHNGSGIVLQAALRDIAAGIDFAALKSSAMHDVLGYLYRTPAERAEIAAKLVGHPGVVKARSYADKLLVLAPKSTESYSGLAYICEYSRDLPGLRAVAERARQSELDVAQDAQEYRDYLSGKSDPKKLEETRTSVTRATTALDSARPVGGRTFAIAVGRYVTAKTSAWAMGEPADADELVFSVISRRAAPRPSSRRPGRPRSARSRSRASVSLPPRHSRGPAPHSPRSA